MGGDSVKLIVVPEVRVSIKVDDMVVDLLLEHPGIELRLRVFEIGLKIRGIMNHDLPSTRILGDNQDLLGAISSGHC